MSNSIAMKVFTNTVINCIVAANYPHQCKDIALLKYIKTFDHGNSKTNVLKAINSTNNWKELPITYSSGFRVIVGDFKFKDS